MLLLDFEAQGSGVSKLGLQVPGAGAQHDAVHLGLRGSEAGSCLSTGVKLEHAVDTL